MPSTALIVEDELLIALALGEAIEEAGLQVIGMLALGEEAVEMVGQLRPDVVVMDVRLAGRMDGIEAARIIRRDWHGPIVFHSAETSTAAVEAMAAVGVSALVSKPTAAATVAAVAADMVRANTPVPLTRRREPARVPARN